MSLLSIHHKVEQGTEEWYRLRMGRFTASNISALLATKGDKGRQNEIKRVAFELLYDVRPDGFESPWMGRGKDLEVEARDAYQATTFTVVDTCGFFTYGDSMGASPDGLIGDDGTVEIKCVKYNTFIDYVIADRVPPEYVPQIQTQLLCTDRQWCDFIAYHPGVPLFIKRIERDEEMIQSIIVAVDVAMASAQELITKIKNKCQ